MQYKMTVRDSEEFDTVYGTIIFNQAQNFTQEDWHKIDKAVRYVHQNVDDWTLEDIIERFKEVGFDVEYEELPDSFIRV